MRTRSGCGMPPSWSSAFAGGSSSGQTPSSSARASSGRCDWRIRSLRWWSNVGYRKKRSCSISKCLFSSRIPPLRRVRSCSPSASARTVTAHSLKATGIGERNLRNAASRHLQQRRAGRGRLILANERPGFKWKISLSLLDCPDHRSEVLLRVPALGCSRKQRLHERAQAQLHPERARLVQAVADVLQHVLELEQRRELAVEHRPALQPEDRGVAGAARGHLEEA